MLPVIAVTLLVRRYPVHGLTASSVKDLGSPMAHPKPYTGVFPIAPTPFTDAGELDLEGQRRVLDCMVDQGVDGICILANYSEQFLLSDVERDTLLDLCLSHIAGRVPLIVTCSHFSTRLVIERARRAAAAGASMLMLMPPYHGATLHATEQRMIEHFARVAEAAPIPIMLQDAPLSGVALSVPLLVRLAREVPSVCYFKIEVPRAAAKLRSLIEAGGESIAGPFDGEEAITLMADFEAGATGTMPSALLPELIKQVLQHFRADRRAAAAAAYARILPLINFENRQCGLSAAKAVMTEGGVIKSEAVRHPLEQLHPATRAQLLDLARPFDLVALRWGK
jgi:2-keto-3-deoxy-L-arabinonate dehydratase